MKLIIKILLLLLLTLNTGNIYSQQAAKPLTGRPKIDSLLKELSKAKEDTNKCKILSNVSYAYKSIAPDTSILYLRQDSALATQLGWKKGMAWFSSSQAVNYKLKSDYPKALEYCFKALKLYEEIGDKQGIANVTGNIGNVYQSQSDYPKALEYYFKALTLSEELSDRNGTASTSCNIGNLYSRQSDYPKALEYLFKALKLYEELGDRQRTATVIGNIGNVYQSQGDYPKALEYYYKSLKLKEEFSDKVGIASSTSNIGSVYLRQKNYLMAVEYSQRALKLSEEVGNKYLMSCNLCNIGNTYIAIVKDAANTEVTKRMGSNRNIGNDEVSGKGDMQQIHIPESKKALLAGAIDYLQRGLTICKEIKNLSDLQEGYSSLSTAYKLKGDFKKAMEYGDSSKIIKDSVFSQENRQKITNLENARKAYGDSLTAADTKRAADVKAEHRRNYELIGGGVLILALGFIFMLTRNNKLLGKEKKRSDSLLLNILPEEVADQLKDTGKSAAKQFDDVTVLFTDFVNFTEASGRMKPEVLIEELDTCFKKFDEITGKYNVEKIKTIGDAYLAVAGLPTADSKHAENAVRAAIEINSFMQDRVAKLGERTFAIRIGIHSGSVVAGIVGVKKFAYDIWGDTVNTAARMEQNSESGKINISATTYELVKDKISCEYRGEIDAKGKGVMKMYYVG